MQEEMQEKILRNIAKNGKLSTEDLAAMLAASPEEIEKEMNAMEEQGIICGYPTLINWDKTGCEHVTALIEVTVAPERGRGFDKVAERIYQFDEVESLYYRWKNNERGCVVCRDETGTDGIGYEYGNTFCFEKI